MPNRLSCQSAHAFAGPPALPALLSSLGLATMVIIPAAIAALGAATTMLLPEPKGQGLESLTDDPIVRMKVRPR